VEEQLRPQNGFSCFDAAIHDLDPEILVDGAPAKWADLQIRLKRVEWIGQGLQFGNQFLGIQARILEAYVNHVLLAFGGHVLLRIKTSEAVEEGLEFSASCAGSCKACPSSDSYSVGIRVIQGTFQGTGNGLKAGFLRPLYVNLSVSYQQAQTLIPLVLQGQLAAGHRLSVFRRKGINQGYEFTRDTRKSRASDGLHASEYDCICIGKEFEPVTVELGQALADFPGEGTEADLTLTLQYALHNYTSRERAGASGTSLWNGLIPLIPANQARSTVPESRIQNTVSSILQP
jgi:hypothetical protein